MIKYCCYYCKHFKGDCELGKPCCYPALGGEEYVKLCKVVDGECGERITNNGLIKEANKECWEAREY